MSDEEPDEAAEETEEDAEEEETSPLDVLSAFGTTEPEAEGEQPEAVQDFRSP